MFVLDASALLDALVAERPEPDLLARLASDQAAAPHLIDLEVLHALRRLERLGDLSADRTADARADFADVSVLRFPHEPLADRIWELRGNLSSYDGAYVALAEALDCPLITCDTGLARAASAAAVEYFGPAGQG